MAKNGQISLGIEHANAWVALERREGGIFLRFTDDPLEIGTRQPRLPPTDAEALALGILEDAAWARLADADVADDDEWP